MYLDFKLMQFLSSKGSHFIISMLHLFADVPTFKTHYFSCTFSCACGCLLIVHRTCGFTCFATRNCLMKSAKTHVSNCTSRSAFSFPVNY